MNRKLRNVLLSLVCLTIVGLVCLAYAYFIEPHRLVVNRTELAVKDWNKAFDGFKIVMIGDIHGGSVGVDDDMLHRVVARANEQNADLIVLLGDYVSERRNGSPITDADLKMPIAQIADGLAGMHATYGVMAVLGNHDGWFCDQCVRNELTRVGYRVLENQVITVGRNGQQLRIIGLPDHLKVKSWDAFSGAAKNALAPTEGSGDVLALEHGPDILPVITKERLISPDMRLILAAHTHGGQVWLPIFGSAIVPSSYGQKYAFGHIRENNVDMFVTTGIGTSILPLRFLMPPEIAVLTIRSE